MSLLSRIANAFRAVRDIDKSVEHGRDPIESCRAFGPPLPQRESRLGAKVIARLDFLRADVVFGWRQLNKHNAASAAAILSLGLAIGACTPRSG